MPNKDFFIKAGYSPRTSPEYFHDTLSDTVGIIHQPDVYPLAAYLGERFGCTHVIDIGCGVATKLTSLHPQFEIIGIDFGANIQLCRQRYGFGMWIEMDLEQPDQLFIPQDVLERSVIVCIDVIEHLVNPTHLLQRLRDWMNYAPVCLLSTPERDLVRGQDHLGPPPNPHHVREWNIVEFEALIRAYGFNLTFIGLTANNNNDYEKKNILAVIERKSSPNLLSTPRSFRVVAIIAAYNEADIIIPSIKYLISQGVQVYIIDNWSTDGTYELVQQLQAQANDVIGVERFPQGGPSPYCEWRTLLKRKEELTREIAADWFIHQDVDEIRCAPWPGVSLRDAIYRVDSAGFNAIDHTVIVFHPTDDAFTPGSDFEEHFRYFEFGKRPGHFVQVKAWKNLGKPVSLAESGGHDIRFEGRRIYPYKFLLKHYPVRSQAHGEKKVFLERQGRWHPQEKAAGMHIHYEGIVKGHAFLSNPADLELFEEDDFARRYLVERLSGIGVVREAARAIMQNPQDNTGSGESARICGEPNKFARPARLELYDHSAVFHGYQEFVLTKDWIRVLPEDLNTQRKQYILAPYFRSSYLKHRTVLDVGANAGFFCFWALQNGADRAIAIDIDENYLRMVEEARTKLGFHNLEVIKANFSDWNDPADIVLALALIHWIYSCTALLGSLDSAVEKLSQLTKYMLIIEWIDPTDPAIASFHHLDWNRGLVREPYTLEAFEGALARHFVRYLHIGDITPTRRLYIAFHTPYEIDLSGPLPLILPKESVIYSRCLSKVQGIEYWSRIYDGGDVIYKQATLNLAEREAYFLSKLASDYFPRIREVKSTDEYSIIALEKIHGIPLREAIDYLNADLVRLHSFIQHCLNLLSELKQQGILHRDIRPENILVRDDKPVLIDFGWAISEEQPYLTPPSLGGLERPPDGSFCDVYSMGKVLEQVNRHRYPTLDQVIGLMAAPDASLRVTDLKTLKILFALAADPATDSSMEAVYGREC